MFMWNKHEDYLTFVFTFNIISTQGCVGASTYPTWFFWSCGGIFITTVWAYFFSLSGKDHAVFSGVTLLQREGAKGIYTIICEIYHYSSVALW